MQDMRSRRYFLIGDQTTVGCGILRVMHYMVINANIRGSVSNSISFLRHRGNQADVHFEQVYISASDLQTIKSYQQGRNLLND